MEIDTVRGYTLPHLPPIGTPRVLESEFYVLIIIVEQPDRLLEEATVIEKVCLLTQPHIITGLVLVRAVDRFAGVPQVSVVPQRLRYVQTVHESV